MSHWAEKYIGRPWVSGADGPEAFDCFGLLAAIYRERLGVAVPRIPCDAARVASCVRALGDAAAHALFDPLGQGDAPRELDAVQMSLSRRPHHVGLWLDIDGGGVLAAVEGAGVVFQSRRALARAGWRITDVYRLKAA